MALERTADSCFGEVVNLTAVIIPFSGSSKTTAQSVVPSGRIGRGASAVFGSDASAPPVSELDLVTISLKCSGSEPGLRNKGWPRDLWLNISSREQCHGQRKHKHSTTLRCGIGIKMLLNRVIAVSVLINSAGMPVARVSGS